MRIAQKTLLFSEVILEVSSDQSWYPKQVVFYLMVTKKLTKGFLHPTLPLGSVSDFLKKNYCTFLRNISGPNSNLKCVTKRRVKVVEALSKWIVSFGPELFRTFSTFSWEHSLTNAAHIRTSGTVTLHVLINRILLKRSSCTELNSWKENYDRKKLRPDRWTVACFLTFPSECLQSSRKLHFLVLKLNSDWKICNLLRDHMRRPKNFTCIHV